MNLACSTKGCDRPGRILLGNKILCKLCYRKVPYKEKLAAIKAMEKGDENDA
jgi:hypothetical protein